MTNLILAFGPLAKGKTRCILYLVHELLGLTMSSSPSRSSTRSITARLTRSGR
uniref:Uncharacterized protein n=1 Tax=Hyaloperonospora arabidopsidis (strain Emoy2) TaxID=559515 RepID=M4BZ08_HYAAE